MLGSNFIKVLGYQIPTLYINVSTCYMTASASASLGSLMSCLGVAQKITLSMTIAAGSHRVVTKNALGKY